MGDWARTGLRIGGQGALSGGNLLPSLTSPKSSYFRVKKEGSGLQTLALALRTAFRASGRPDQKVAGKAPGSKRAPGPSLGGGVERED